MCCIITRVYCYTVAEQPQTNQFHIAFYRYASFCSSKLQLFSFVFRSHSFTIVYVQSAQAEAVMVAAVAVAAAATAIESKSRMLLLMLLFRRTAIASIVVKETSQKETAERREKKNY